MTCAPSSRPLLNKASEDITAGHMTYDLRRLRAHGLIERIPHTRRYTVTDTGLQHALLFTHAHDHLLGAGLAQVSDPARREKPRCTTPPAPTSRLRGRLRRTQPTGSTRSLSPHDPNRKLDSRLTAAPLKLD
ncbi:MAG: hypothetical protein PHQ28_11515 [Mycobacterium sp.]|nr:hypothetical protein [Mycobacterium sp.]